MRWATASIFFLIACFVFFILFAVMSYLLTTVGDGLGTYASGLASNYADTITLLQYAFGVICLIFLVAGIVLIYVVDSFSEDDELYYRDVNEYRRY